MDMKNMVIMKNLPSNIIEEAFVILKDNKIAKKMEYSQKMEQSHLKNMDNQQVEDYIIKEAQMVIQHYIEKGEEVDKNQVLEKKYKKMKWINMALAFACILAFIL